MREGSLQTQELSMAASGCINASEHHTVITLTKTLQHVTEQSDTGEVSKCYSSSCQSITAFKPCAYVILVILLLITVITCFSQTTD